MKRVAFIAKPLSAYAVLARIAGYPKSLFAYGIPHQQNLVCRGNPDDPGFIQKVFRDCRPEASVCANDFTAARVLAGLVSHGIRVPEEIRIVGIDDVKYSGLLPVPLTTQHQNCADIGAMATVTMLQRVEKPDLPTRDILLQTAPSFADRVEHIAPPSETYSPKRADGLFTAVGNGTTNIDFHSRLQSR